MTDELYPLVEPHEQGMLDVGDGNQVYWEIRGNPAGRPLVVVHGGPGTAGWGSAQRYCDPDRYRVIVFHQRGAGLSTPHASDPATDMRHNTTEHLLADMERLREHLGVERWVLLGGSWGSTLSLAYAERHPDRVSAIVLTAVTTTRRSEIDWLYRGVGRFHPQAWERFRDGVPEAERDGDLTAAYARLLESPDPAIRAKAVRDWAAWEDAVMSLEPNGHPNSFSQGRSADELTALVRICAHYFSHGAWLEEGVLLREAHRLNGIPGALFHGRFDLGGPLDTAWALTRVWTDAELVVVDDSGHMGSPTMRAGMRAALDRFAVTAR